MGSQLTDNVLRQYKGLQREFAGTEERTVERLIGSKEAVEAAIQLLAKGQISEDGFGVLDQIRQYQEEGPFWILEKTWKKTGWSSHEDDGEDATADQPTKSQLNMAMMAKDLRVHKNYRKNWNNDLWCEAPSGTTPPVPAWWNTAGSRSSPQITEGAYVYKWLSANSDGPIAQYQGKVWSCLKTALKPGLEYWQVPAYTIRESGRYLEKSQASWVTQKRAGKITTPIRGDFGVVDRWGGNWLCEGGSVTFDGSMWVAQLNYTWAPAPGWDEDLYQQI